MNTSVSSQVFIPDVNLRLELNDQIPGLINAGGIMDTLHPSIAEMDSLSIFMYLPSNTPTVNMEGVQYLRSLRFFQLELIPYQNTPTVTFPALPDSLNFFWINVNTSLAASILLPQMPNSVRRCFIGNGNLGPVLTDLSIAGLPDSLEQLHISACNFLNLDQNAYVDTLRITYNQFEPGPTSDLIVPAINSNVFILGFRYFNDLDLSAVHADHLYLLTSSIENSVAWPIGMTELQMNFNLNVINDFGNLPSTLTSLYVAASTPYCLPHLPDALTTIELDGNTDCLPNIPASLQSLDCSCMLDATHIRLCSVLTNSCPGVNPGISGHVFQDLNANGAFDTGEPGLPQIPIVTEPSGNLTNCDASGYWSLGVLPGEHTIAPSASYPYIDAVIPVQHTASFPDYGSADEDNDFAITLTPNIQDLRGLITADPPRPGFENRAYIFCDNYGTVAVDAQLMLEFDPLQTFVGSSVAPVSLIGNTALFDLQSMAVGSQMTVTVDLSTPETLTLGTALTHTVTFGNPNTDQTPDDNVVMYVDTVVGSYDPNDKAVQPAVLTPWAVKQGQTPLDYTIRFQNTGTYLAERVVILDTLSADLLWSTFQFKGSSHPSHWYVVDGVLHVIHNDINLPDSTSDEANSHGFVRFSIIPSTDLTDGATITNIAHIVFDFNEPIVTPPAVFNVDITAGVADRRRTSFSIYPNPVHDRLGISLPDQQRTLINYRISDLLGKVVLNGASANGGVDVQNLAPGLYTLTLGQAGVGESVRFVKD